jgi:alpha-glucosidase
MRAMFLEYPLDKETYKTDYQYFFGDSLMVAPIYDYSNSPIYEAKRDIYLPEGQWIDYWTDDVYEGGRHINYTASFEVLPMFVRKGSIVVYGNEIHSMSEYKSDNLEIHIYPSKEKAVTTVYDDDGTSMEYRDGEIEETEIEAIISGEKLYVKVFPTKGAYKGQFHVTDMHFVIHLLEPITRVHLNSKTTENAKKVNETVNWEYDTGKRLLHIFTKVDKTLGVIIEANN